MDNANELEQVIQIVRGLDRLCRLVPLASDDIGAFVEDECREEAKDLYKHFVGVLISGHTLDYSVQSL